jgi:hypothetical protein
MPEDKSNETTTSEAAPIQTPFCGQLRSKKYFMLDRLAVSPEDFIDATNHVWCCETQEVIGPDNRRVSTDNCRPGRACYSSALKGV